MPNLKRNLVAGAGTLVSLICFFAVRYSPRLRATGDRPRTLVNLVTDISSEDAGTLLLSLFFSLFISLTVLLPPLLWVELRVAQRPLGRGMRALLIGQGVLGAVGVLATTFGMALSLASFGFGGGGDPVSAGYYIIIACESVFVIASVVVGLLPG